MIRLFSNFCHPPNRKIGHDCYYECILLHLVVASLGSLKVEYLYWVGSGSCLLMVVQYSVVILMFSWEECGAQVLLFRHPVRKSRRGVVILNSAFSVRDFFVCLWKKRHTAQEVLHLYTAYILLNFVINFINSIFEHSVSEFFPVGFLNAAGSNHSQAQIGLLYYQIGYSMRSYILHYYMVTLHRNSLRKDQSHI